jgi:2-dehydro-3-deoxygalactonokinase
LSAAVAPGPAFLEGVADSGPDLLSRLFEIRAASVLGRRGDDEAASYASGLLIGTDVSAQGVAGRDVHVLAEPDLGALYEAAIASLGGRAHAVDSRAAFLAGIKAIWSRL